MRVQDVDTGKVHLVGFKKRRQHQGGFVVVWQEALREVASLRLTPTQFQVLLRLLADCEYENRVEFFITDLAEAVKRDRGEVSRALTELAQMEFLHTIENRRGRKRVCLLDPELSFAGNADQRDAVRKRWAGVAASP